MFKNFLFILSGVILFFFLSCGDDPAPSAPDDDNNPTVSITSPLNNSEYDDGTSISIMAIASDDDGVKEVRFFIDGVMESTDADEPWEYMWNSEGRSGAHSVFARAYNTGDKMGESQTISVTINNGVPVAAFSVQPTSGEVSTIFQVDASGSTDREDAIENLQVRWDWEDDGTWDTNYSTTKIETHQFDSESIKTIRLEVKDTYEQTDTTSIDVTISNDPIDPGTVTDFDGNVYTTVKIGNQLWMVENLRVTHYRNGNEIPFVYSSQSWFYATSGGYCYYDNNAASIAEYGLLYNFHAVNNANQIAPEGWHVATHEDWKELEMYLGMSEEQADLTLWRGTDEGGKLKETGLTHWNNPNTGATNESGFTAIPGGYRESDFGNYNAIGIGAYFWTSTGLTASNNVNAVVRILTNSESRISRVGLPRTYGLSIRCVKDL